MFIEFQVGNFRSFRDLQKFTLQAAKLRSNENGFEEGNVFESSGIRLLKSKAIYGANASGKSNIVKAIGAFTLLVNKSVSNEGLTKTIWDERFQKISDWDEQPIFFQYIFSKDEKVYRYGFQILNERISYEWLFEGDDNQENEIFMRTPEKIKADENYFSNLLPMINSANNGKNEIFRNDSLFLTAAAINANNFAGNIRQEIQGLITVEGSEGEAPIWHAITILDKGTQEQKDNIINLMIAADTGLAGLKILEVPDKFIPQNSDFQKEDKENKKLKGLFSEHNKYDDDGNIESTILVPFGKWESNGTKKLFGLIALALDSLKEGAQLIIDEIDAKLHPNLTLKIVELFNNSSTNLKNAQLIFVTHDSSLLSRAKLRRDQICFIEKDKYGVSTVKTLINYKGVRKDESFEKEYLSGSYNAVPYLNKMDSVFKFKTEPL